MEGAHGLVFVLFRYALSLNEPWVTKASESEVPSVCCTSLQRSKCSDTLALIFKSRVNPDVGICCA
jgi:hypothetical protein